MEESFHLTLDENNRVRQLRRKIEKIYKREELRWRQRAHANWLKEEYANTAFFHRWASRRHRTNKIHHLRVGVQEVSGGLLKEHVHQHFKKLFGRKNNFRVCLREGAVDNEVELSYLEEEFREEEINR